MSQQINRDSSPDTPEKQFNERDIRDACTQLSIAYARAVDFRDYAAFVELFTEDGELDTGRPLRGKIAIREAMNRRPDELRSRHVMTNIFIEAISADSARGIAYLTLYRHIGPESLRGAPIEFTGPAAVGHYEDRFVRTTDGFRFARRKLHLSFHRSELF